MVESEIDVYERLDNFWTTSFFYHFASPRRNFAVDAGYCYIWLAGGYASDGVAPVELDGNLLLSPSRPNSDANCDCASKSDANTLGLFCIHH